MAQFRELTGNEAQMEFALAVLHESSSADAVAKVFKEGRDGNVLPQETLDDLENKAKALAPIQPFEENDERRKKVELFRDELFLACGI